MAILRGREAEEYLRNNPTGAFRVVSGGERLGIPSGSVAPYTDAKKDRGFLGNLLWGVTKPLRFSFGGLADSLRLGAEMAPGMARGMTAQESLRGAEDFKPMFLDEGEFQDYLRRPGQTAAKTIAQLASYMVPGSIGKTGFGGAVKGGALAGGLYGAGEADDITNIGDVASSAGKGALFGGAAGGAMYGATEGVKALKNVLQGKTASASKLASLRGKAVGLDPNKMVGKRGANISSRKQAQEVIDDFINTMDEYGASTRTSNITAKNLDEVQSKLSQKVEEALSGAGTKFTAEDTLAIDSAIQRELKNSGLLNSKAASQPYKEVMADLMDLGESYTPAQLEAIRKKARDVFTNWSRSGNVYPKTERVARIVFDKIDGHMMGKPGLENVKPLLRQQSNIYKVEPFILSKAGQGGVAKVGTVSTHIGLPTMGADEALMNTLGRAGQKAAALTPVLTPTTSSRSALVDVLLGSSAVPVAAAAAAFQDREEGSVPGHTGDEAMSSVSGAVSREELTANFMNLLNQGFSPTEAIKTLEFLGLTGGSGGEEKLSKDQANAKAALQSLDTAEQILGTDSSALGLSYLPFGFGNENAQVLETALLNIEDVIARMRTGAVINDEEARRYRKMMPRITDTAETKQYKIQQLRSIFNRILQGKQGEQEYVTEDDLLSVLGG